MQTCCKQKRVWDFGKPCVNDIVAAGIVMHRHKLGTQPCRNQIYSRVIFLRHRHDTVHSFPWCTFSQPNIHPFWLPERKPKPGTYCLLTAKCCFRGCKRCSAEYQCISNVPVTAPCKIQNIGSTTLTEKWRYFGDDDDDDAVSLRTQWIKRLQNGCRVERKTAQNYESVCISFLAVQVIFICVYITNYLHFFHCVFKFLTP